MPKSLFISYSRADMVDTDWLARMKLFLAPFKRAGTVDVWDDGRIGTGADWRDEIARALDSAAVAILLVGPGFLASDFINDHELPTLLAAAKSRGLKILPVVVGYSSYKASVLEPYQAANEPDQPLESLARPDQNKILNSVAMEVDTVLRAQPAAFAAPQANPARSERDVLREISHLLADTYAAFQAQIRRRDDLVEMIETRLRIVNDLEYEKFFYKHYAELNAAERFEFDQIRAMTEGPMSTGNRKVLQLLSEQPDLLDEIPELLDLKQHLVFWLNKYDRIFVNNRAMSVLYTGVEDGMPFPAGIDGVIERRLKAHRE